MLLDNEKVTLFLGNFGSGKTEVSVNFALHVADGRLREGVTIVDLDLVNPYFRSRESRDVLQNHGIRVVIPETQYLYADLPILIPEVRSLLVASTGYVILDVGGDDVGARVLGSLHDALGSSSYRALMVINASRPFTGSVEGIVRIMSEIEEAGKVTVGGFVSNTHLMAETTLETILRGYGLALEAQEKTGLPLAFVCAPAAIADEVRAKVSGDVLPMSRYLAPAWDGSRGGAMGKGLFKS